MRIQLNALVFLLFTACGTDEFSAPSIELQARLAEYLETNNPGPVYEWESQYHGEAPGHQMRIDFVRWGNRHSGQMTALLNGWPARNRENVLELLEWSALDSGQQVYFKTTIIAQQADPAGPPTAAPIR